MTRVVIPLLLAFSTIVAAVSHTPSQDVQTAAQGGDQFLDGIGETALIARYTFNGNADDSSRNQLHATLRGAGGVFVDDASGRRVLLLTGDGSHVQLPSGALDGEDAITVVGWLYLPTGASGPVFDFGQSSETRLFAVVDARGFRASTVIDGQVGGETPSSPIVVNQWRHFAVVLDPASRVLTTYLDGTRVGQATGVTVTPAQLVPQASATTRLLLGRSQDDAAPSLHGRLRDVRIYRLALGDAPIATIHRNALATAASSRGRDTAPPEILDRRHPARVAVRGAADERGRRHRRDGRRHAAEASVQHPRHVRGWHDGRRPRHLALTHRQLDGAGSRHLHRDRPRARHALRARATVIVKVPVGTTTAPERLVEAFALDRVVLDRDAQGRDTPFIRNRDKFLRGLAATNPDSFLYNFRDAFGQPQPAGAVALEGWDNQTTRLRGHASGHYLTAIAQAYASTGYDPALRRRSARRCTTSSTRLHDLSQKSGRPVREGGPFVADPTAVPIGPGREGYDSNLRAGAIRTDYWNWGTGFISAYPPDQFIMLERGATYGTQDSQIWAPYYTLHKILAGLLDVYEVAGNEKALDIARGMGAWVHARLQRAAARDAHGHVEPLHRRRVRRHERGDGAPVPAHGRSTVPRHGAAVRQHRVLLRQREPRPRPGQGRRYHPRQARQPAHPADHGRARDIPRPRRSCRTT